MLLNKCKFYFLLIDFKRVFFRKEFLLMSIFQLLYFRHILLYYFLLSLVIVPFQLFKLRRVIFIYSLQLSLVLTKLFQNDHIIVLKLLFIECQFPHPFVQLGHRAILFLKASRHLLDLFICFLNLHLFIVTSRRSIF